MSHPIPTLPPAPPELVDTAAVFVPPPLATPDQYQALTGSTPPAGLLEQASAAVRRYCGWHVSPVLREWLVADGTGGAVIGLPTLLLIDVIEVAEPGRTDGAYPDGAVPLSGVDWSATGYLRRLGGSWTKRERGVWALVHHGFPVELAADLAALVCIMAARAEENPQGAQGASIGSVSVQFTGADQGAAGIGLSVDQQNILDRYRLWDA